MVSYQPRISFNSSKGPWTFDFTINGLESKFKRYAENSHNVQLLAVFWVSLLGDSPTDFDKPVSVVRAFASRLADDATGTIRSFASIYDRLTRSVIRASDGTLFIQEFISEFKNTPIFREYLEFTKTHSAVLFKYISTFLLFGKKVYFEDASFEAAALCDWLETERRLGGVEFVGDNMQDLAEIMGWIMQDFDDTLFLPKHGGGSVAEKARNITDKNKLLYNDEELTSLFARPFTIGPTIPYTSCESSTPSVQGLHKISRLTFVPKDIGKARSICMEPAILQFTQQAVRLWVEEAMAAKVGRHVPLHDQTKNQDLARYGSATGWVDTIDLSQASDSVHIDLVRRIFPPAMLPYLLGTRSTAVEMSDGRTQEIHKYAPMGSALCFPVQSAIYTAVVLYSSLVWRFGETAGSNLKIDRRVMYHYYEEVYADRGKYRLQPFSIYGDDIICDKRITHIVIETLQKLGFVVNGAKSFTGMSAFRESCGGYYLLGEDVTPLRAKLGPMKDTIPISTMDSVIELANRAKTCGYKTLNRTVIQAVLHYPISGARYGAGQTKNEILFTADQDASFALQHEKPMNRHLVLRSFDVLKPSRDTRYKWQRDELRSISPRPTRVQTLSSGDESYLHVVWWRSRLASITDSEISKRIPVSTGPVWRWTAQAG